jgi:MYXO-CTERM domain-containing protein
MFRKLSLNALATGALAVSGLLAGIQTAEAGPVKLAFDPAYGAPFGQLGWRGEAIVDDGNCGLTGTLNNFSGPCSGEFTFTSAKVEFYNTSDVGTTLQTINFTGAAVGLVERSNVLTADKVYSSPFNPQQGLINETKFGSTFAYFSLIFAGDYAQLYWFDYNPGNPLLSPLAFPYVNFFSLPSYLGCYLAGPADPNTVPIKSKQCGLSANDNGKGAKLTFTPVPEPSSYALALAALGALAVSSRRRSRNFRAGA